MTTSSIDLIKILEGFLQDPETALHKVLVYILYNTKHEERRRRARKDRSDSMGLRYARYNYY
jgi:hypothetical protein